MAGEIVVDFSPFFRVHKSGEIERFIGLESVPPSLDPQTGVSSKDVVVSPESNLSARLFLPSSTVPGTKLPLLLYFHGGGFVVESAFSPFYHRHLNSLVAAAGVVALSLDYRLAPEHPLPAAYDDAWIALKYAASTAADEWIGSHADLSRLYLGGDSAGGNIVHNVVARLSAEPLAGINVTGAFLNCPYFTGKEAIEDEEWHPMFPKRFLDELWLYVCPTSGGCDDPRVNPESDRKLLGKLGCQKVLVVTAGKDVLRWRGRHYKEALEGSGWEGRVEFMEYEEEDHVFSVYDPSSENGRAMLRMVGGFINP